jgi:endonuclease/exonuclease/phosphatase family metal-dependent hydrolase
MSYLGRLYVMVWSRALTKKAQSLSYRKCMVCGNFLQKLREFFLLELLVYTIVCSACQESPQTSITIGTFNMEWLGDNTADDRKPRTTQDLLLLASAIRDTEADILAVQEIENEQAIKKLLAYLPEYRFVLGESGGKQHVGFLYKTNLEIQPLGEVMSIAVEPNRTRAGLLVQYQSGARKWLLLAVHLKSTSRADSSTELRERSRELRSLQSAQIRAWSDSIQTRDSLMHVVILGDFNDSPIKKNIQKKTTLDTLKNAPHLVFLTSQMHSCTYEALPTIDHILCSTQAMKRFVWGSLHTVNTHVMLTEPDAKRISDHCAVVCQFDVSGK